MFGAFVHLIVAKYLDSTLAPILLADMCLFVCPLSFDLENGTFDLESGKKKESA